jgi:tRNA threonylcarbamoyladenosine biosynthesis protein TsaE
MFDFTPNNSLELSLENLHVFTESFIQHIKKYKKDGVVVALSGDLGAGKTTFSKEIALCLGVEDIVISPTFVIQKKYKTKDNDFVEFVHIDAYRIENDTEAQVLKLDELFNSPKTIVCVEWPERIKNILPKKTIWISFETVNENIRKISYKGVI